jgi:hypothetical protein
LKLEGTCQKLIESFKKLTDYSELTATQIVECSLKRINGQYHKTDIFWNLPYHMLLKTVAGRIFLTKSNVIKSSKCLSLASKVSNKKAQKYSTRETVPLVQAHILTGGRLLK